MNEFILNIYIYLSFLPFLHFSGSYIKYISIFCFFYSREISEYLFPLCIILQSWKMSGLVLYQTESLFILLIPIVLCPERM